MDQYAELAMMQGVEDSLYGLLSGSGVPAGSSAGNNNHGSSVSLTGTTALPPQLPGDNASPTNTANPMADVATVSTATQSNASMDWVCNICTLRNPMFYESCEACGMLREMMS
jgi:hypothetical protein